MHNRPWFGRGPLVAILVFQCVSAIMLLSPLRGGFWAAKPRQIPNLVEAEKLSVLSKSSDFSLVVQDTSSLPGRRWSNDTQLWGGTIREAEWVDFALPETEPGRYRVSVFLTKASDYGIVQFRVGTDTFGPPIDLYSGTLGVSSATGQIFLGEVDVQVGMGTVLRLGVAGRNRLSTGYYFGIDGILLTRVRP